MRFPPWGKKGGVGNRYNTPPLTKKIVGLGIKNPFLGKNRRLPSYFFRLFYLVIDRDLRKTT